MEAVGKYIVSLCSAAILCGILKNILPAKSANGALLHLVTGIFLTLVAIQPLSSIDLTALPAISDDYLSAAGRISSQGEAAAQNAMADIIKSQSEAYILDKARMLHVTLTVEVTLEAGNPPVPSSIRLTGDISPYAKNRLEAIIRDDLGIPKENQLWIG